VNYRRTKDSVAFLRKTGKEQLTFPELRAKERFKYEMLEVDILYDTPDNRRDGD
jgi:hypothetical protein